MLLLVLNHILHSFCLNVNMFQIQICKISNLFSMMIAKLRNKLLTEVVKNYSDHMLISEMYTKIHYFNYK